MAAGMGGRFSTTKLSPGRITPAPDCPAGPPCASVVKDKNKRDANKITKLADSRFIFNHPPRVFFLRTLREKPNRAGSCSSRKLDRTEKPSSNAFVSGKGRQ